MATPTSRGWWPSRKRQQDVSAEGPLPDHLEVNVTKAAGELCLFWRRQDDDALGVLGSLRSLGRPITVGHARRAAALLREIGEPGALRLARRLEKAAGAQPMKNTWHHDDMPDRVFRRAKPTDQCSYMTDPSSRMRCRCRGVFGVAGARGTFCELHARRTAARVEGPVFTRRRRLYYEKKENAGTPTTSS